MATEQAATTTDGPHLLAPAPWTCKCESYWLMWYARGSLPEHAYSPLEAASAEFSDPIVAGGFKAGLGMIQIVRYLETPVGSYDELLVIPGAFETKEAGRNLRVTRIYVSQKETCYNGRKNWNIPKHLARFAFSHPPTLASSAPPKTLKIEVFPPDPQASKPFFTATLQPFKWIPAVPFSTKILGYLGLDVHLMQPPLPEKPGTWELCGTTEWAKVLPYLYSDRARGMWVDVGKAKGDGNGQGGGDGERQPLLGNAAGVDGWLPEVRPWKIGLWLEEAMLVFPEPERFDTR